MRLLLLRVIAFRIHSFWFETIVTSALFDDFHYLLKCSFFETDRKELLKQYFYTRTNIIKFQHLLANTNKNSLTKLSTFMKIIMNKFANDT